MTTTACCTWIFTLHLDRPEVVHSSVVEGGGSKLQAVWMKSGLRDLDWPWRFLPAGFASVHNVSNSGWGHVVPRSHLGEGRLSPVMVDLLMVLADQQLGQRMLRRKN